MLKNKVLAAFLSAFAILLANCGGSAAQIDYTTSWIGNSGGGANEQWMQMTAGGLYVARNGTCYVNSFYDEGGHEGGIYVEGNVVGAFQGLHGWDRAGGCSVTADRKYVYLGMQQSDCGNTGNMPGFPAIGVDANGRKLRHTWWGVRRYFKNGLPAPWKQLGRRDGKTDSIVGLYDNSMLIVSDLMYPRDTPPPTVMIMGLAVAKGVLYVSDPHTNAVRVYKTSNEACIVQNGSWAVASPGSLAFDRRTRTLWTATIGNGATPSVIKHFTPDGTQLPESITDVDVVRSLAFDPQGNLIVTDGGPGQQVKVYGALSTTPTVVKLLGQRGGILAGVRGLVADDKFNGLVGAGADAAGNLYVSTNGSVTPTSPGTGCTLASFAPDLHKLWELDGLEFIDGADVDPASDGADIYTAQEHFKLDLSQSRAKPKYVGYTIDEQRYPNDPRLHIRGSGSPVVRRIDGKRFLFVTDIHSSCMQIYRFDSKSPVETAIPSGIIATHSMIQYQDPSWLAGAAPTSGPWIWRDVDGNGDFYTPNKEPAQYEFDAGLGAADPWAKARIWAWWVDDNGNVWQASRSRGTAGGIRCFHCEGLDPIGNPIYTLLSVQTTPTPLPFDASMGGVNRIQYDAASDTMYVGGYTTQYPSQIGENGLLGRVLVRYNHWSTSARNVAYQIVLPYNPVTSARIIPMALAVSAQKIFVGYLAGVTSAYGAGGQIAVYDAANGAALGLMSPGPEVGGVSGWIDLPNGLTAYTRSNGDQLIFAEEDFMAKVLMYRIPAIDVADAPPVQINGHGTGLTARYFDDTVSRNPFTKLVQTQIDPKIDLSCVSDPPNPSVKANYYSIAWSGKIEPRYSETYTFHTVSDDGIRVWVDGKIIVDAWGPHSEQTDFGSIRLTAGVQYSIRVAYYQRTNRSTARLIWSSASQSREIVPTSQLYPNEK